MRNFILAVLIAILITYSFGFVASEWFDMSIHLGDLSLSPYESVAGITLVGVAMTIVGVLIAVSLVGALMIAIVAAAIGLLVAGLSAFWPMILILVVVVWLVKDKRQARY